MGIDRGVYGQAITKRQGTDAAERQGQNATDFQKQNGSDWLSALRERIIALKKESADAAFSAFLDQKWMELQGTENALYQIEQSIEQGYQQYLVKMSYRQPIPSSMHCGQTQPVEQLQTYYMQMNPAEQRQTMYHAQMNPAEQRQTMYHMQMQTVEQRQTMYHAQMNPAEQQQTVFQPQMQPVSSVFSSSGQGQPKPVYHPQLQQQAAQAQTAQVLQPAYRQPAPYPGQENPQKSVEFKVGTVIFGMVGIAFLLTAFITFGLNYMNNILQGIFLYAVGIVLIVSSELFVFKRIEKFSYCLTGLGISSLYVVTLLNYIYLAIFPAWVALLITIILTSFFFYLSRKKDSGMIRIICLIGCYLSLVPIHQLKSQLEFLVPAIVVFLVNLAGIYCPVKKRRKVVDYVQYICTFSVIFYLIHLQWLSGLQMWPVYMLVCADILTLHLLYYRTGEETGYRVLYFLGQGIHMGCLLYIGHYEDWLHLGIIGVLALCGVLTALFFRKSLRFAPYLFIAVYSILAYFIDGQSFWLALACLLVFAVNKGCVRFFKEFPVPDAVYTMLSAIGVCFFMRSDDLRILGYTYAACILLSCCFMKRFHKYHIFTALIFGWIFLLTEDCAAFLCSILICTLAAAAIGAGFSMKSKSVRIYGLVLTIFVALKLVAFDFHGATAQIRILVFFIVGLLILGISFGYIYLEKRLNEEGKRLNEEAKRLDEERKMCMAPEQGNGQEKEGEQENIAPTELNF